MQKEYHTLNSNLTEKVQLCHNPLMLKTLGCRLQGISDLRSINNNCNLKYQNDYKCRKLIVQTQISCKNGIRVYNMQKQGLNCNVYMNK